METVTSKIDLATLDAPPALASVQRIVDGFKDFQVLRAGFVSGIFDWLATHGPAAKSAIAEGTGLRGAHLGGFLQALEDLGLLARCEGGYALAPGMDTVLRADSRWCQAPTVAHLLDPTGGWADLGRFLSADWIQTALPAPAVERHPLLNEACRLADRVATRDAFADARTLLCFDGADGLLAAALCQRLPQLMATVVVPPAGLRRAEETLAACGVAERCRLLAGSALDVDDGERFDAALLFHALYPVRKSMGDALAAVAARLAPGGELCSAHWFCLEACETAPGGLRDLDRAVLTDSHPLCHVETFGERFVAAGLGDEGREDIDGPCGHLKLHFASRALNPVVVSPYLRCSRC